MRPTRHMGTLIGGQQDGLKFKGEEPHPRSLCFPLFTPLTIPSEKDITEDNVRKDEYIQETIATGHMSFTFYRHKGLTLEQAIHRLLSYYKG